ncbi:MAG: hypothetical protein AAF297_07635 [Planctomycetota bacterium]
MQAPRVRITAGLALLALAGMSDAQTALDRSLYAGGGVNPVSRPQPSAVRAPIYTLNRDTGTFGYNRTNAFNDRTYSIYERQTYGLFDSGVASPKARRFATSPGGAPTGPLARNLTPATSWQSVPSVAGVSRSPYSAAPAVARPPSLSAPVYRP